MKRKSRRYTKTRRSAKKTRKQRGGAYKACKDYYLQSGPQPAIPNPRIRNNSYTMDNTGDLYLIMKDLYTNKIKDDTLVVLKLGSNDIKVSGYSGTKGKLFGEPWIKSKYTKVIHIQIAPETSGMYPFEDEEGYPDNKDFKKYSSNEQYIIPGYFPIAPTSDKNTNEILSYIINHKGPLILFNAMGSYCFNILKYIIDMRESETVYGGYVDAPSVAKCDTVTKIYPNPEERCKELKEINEKEKENKKKYTLNFIFEEENPTMLQAIGQFYFQKYKDKEKTRSASGALGRFNSSIFQIIAKNHVTPDEAYLSLKQLKSLDKLKNTTKKRLLNVVKEETLKA